MVYQFYYEMKWQCLSFLFFAALCRLFSDSDNRGWRAHIRKAKVEKVKCFLNYFSVMKSRQYCISYSGPQAVIYERRRLPMNRIPEWDRVKVSLGKLTVFSKGLIENQIGTLTVDFANELVGNNDMIMIDRQSRMKLVCMYTLLCMNLIINNLFCIIRWRSERKWSSHGGNTFCLLS